jgi:uncharacterized protein YbaR (Trm112 family)
MQDEPVRVRAWRAMDGVPVMLRVEQTDDGEER